jgi:hypothetical protein
MDTRSALQERATPTPPCATLTIAQKTAEIEQLAVVLGLTPHMTMVILRSLAECTFTGAALRDAWRKAELAIACGDATDPADQDFEMYAERARVAIGELIDGPRGLPRESTPLFGEVVSELGCGHLVTRASQMSAADLPEGLRLAMEEVRRNPPPEMTPSTHPQSYKMLGELLDAREADPE